MRILLLGGSKSGKSMLGQRLTRQLAGGGPMIYWATLEPRDGRDRAIVRRHGAGGLGLPDPGAGPGAAPGTGGGAAGERRAVRQRNGVPGVPDVLRPAAGRRSRRPDGPGAADRQRHPRHFVCVCDELWRDGVTYEPWTEHYRRGLAEICRALAAEFDAVAELAAGCVRVWKGAAGCVIGSADFSWPGACSWPFPAPGRYGVKAPGRKCWCAYPWWACWPEAYGPGRGF